MTDPTYRRWGSVALIMVVAVALRVYHLGHNSLWADELYSLECSSGNCTDWMKIPRGSIIESPQHTTELSPSSGSVGHVWSSLQKEWHPPFYFVALRLWTEVFGSGDVAIRSLSLIASLIGIVLLFDIGRLLLGEKVALAACLLMAVAHTQIWYAQEARSYAMLEAWLLGATAALVRIEHGGFRLLRGIGLGLCLLGTMLTHYFGAAGCLAIGCYAMIRLRGGDRLRTFAVMGAAASAYLALWGPFLLQQNVSPTSDPGWLGDATAGFFRRWVLRLIQAPFKLFSELRPGERYWPELLSVLLFTPMLWLRRRPVLLLPALCAVALIAMPALTDLFRHTQQLEFERYYLASGPFVCLLVASLLSGPLSLAMRYVVPAGVFLFCVLTLPSRLFGREKEDWRLLSRTISAHVAGSDVLILYMQFDWLNGVAYLANSHYGEPTLPRTVLLKDAPTSELLSTLHTAGRVWIATWDPIPDLDRLFPGFRAARVERIGTLANLVELRAIENQVTVRDQALAVPTR